LPALAQHYSKDPAGQPRRDWDAVDYYLYSGSNGWTVPCKAGLVNLFGLSSGIGLWKEKHVGENISVCQKPLVPAQAPNDPSSQDWIQMFVYSDCVQSGKSESVSRKCEMAENHH